MESNREKFPGKKGSLQVPYSMKPKGSRNLSLKRGQSRGTTHPIAVAGAHPIQGSFA